MTFNAEFIKTYKRNASLVGIRSTEPKGTYTYYHDIVTYLGEHYVATMEKIALLFNYSLHTFNDNDPNDEYWMEVDVPKPGIVSYIFSHVEYIEVKNRNECHKRSLDKINAKNWYDSYLKNCQKLKSQKPPQKQQVQISHKHEFDSDFDIDFDSDFDPEDHFDPETFGIERLE
jgi:hypothetical protein